MKQVEIAWRHWLPVGQTILYCALVWWGFHESYPRRATVKDEAPVFLPVQETSIEFDAVYICGPPPRGFRVAVALNLPAVLPAMLILLPLGGLQMTLLVRSLVEVASVGVFVPFLWWGVGWWIDHGRRLPDRWLRLGIRARKVVTVAAVCVSGFVCFLSFPFLVMAMWRLGSAWTEAAVSAAILGWSGWVLWIARAEAKGMWRAAKEAA